MQLRSALLLLLNALHNPISTGTCSTGWLRRYVEVGGWPHPEGPGRGDVVGLAVGSGTVRTGHLETSDTQVGGGQW